MTEGLTPIIAVDRALHEFARGWYGERVMQDHDEATRVAIAAIAGVERASAWGSIVMAETSHASDPMVVARAILRASMPPIAGAAIVLPLAIGVAPLGEDANRQAVNAAKVAGCRMFGPDDDRPLHDLAWWSQQSSRVSRIEVWRSAIDDPDNDILRLGCHAFLERQLSGA